MTSPLVPAKTFKSFADLALAYRENEDYRITCQPRDDNFACIVAPHGGGIEPNTSDIAHAIAGTEFSLYLFEGIRPTDNHEALHLTSQCFDEPSCLKMLACSDYVVTIHGCNVKGEVVLIGGLDNALGKELQKSLTDAGVKCQSSGHAFPGTHPDNICNRGRQKIGAQLELSLELRQSPNRHRLVMAVRKVLLQRAAAKGQPNESPLEEPSDLRLPDSLSIPRALAADPARQAVSTILGYVYQIWWSIDAWLQLRSPEDVIFLEGAEDLDKIVAGAATAEQVKHEAAALSLNNKRAHEALENFWALSEREPVRRVDFHYVTTASATTEQDAQFGGMRGLEAWRVAQTSTETANVIRLYLAPKLKTTSLLRKFLETATPEHVQDRLIRRFHWFLDQPGLDEVKQSVDDRLVHRLNQANLPLSYVEKVRNRLHAFACDVLIRPELSKRRLNEADLLRAIEAATTENVPVPTLQYQQFRRALQSGAFDPGGALLQLMRLPLPAAPKPLLARPALIEQVRLRIGQRKAVLLMGSVYKGKTTVAQLVANALCPDAWWFPVSMRSGTETDNLMRALAAVISDESVPSLVVVDDIDLAPSAHAAYRQSLALMASRASRAGRGLLLTARGTSSSTAQLSDFAGIEAVDVPEMCVQEVQQHCLANGCPVELLQAWAAFVRASTQGHPKLVQVRIVELAARGWPAPGTDAFSASPAITTARQTARQLLSETVSQGDAAFVYTAAEATFPMTRQMLLGLAQLVGGIPNAGDLIDRLQGKWLESAIAERMSVTPMLRGSAAEVWPPKRKQLAHRHVFDAIARFKTLDVGDAASLLFQAYMSQEGSRLVHCARMLETIGESRVSSAIFQQLVWLPYVALSAGQRFFEAQPYVSAILRQLQFSVANDVDSDSLLDVLARWTDEVNMIPEQEPREAMEVLRCSKLLSNRNPRVPVRTKLSAIVSLSKAKGEPGRVAEELVQRVIATSRELPGGIPENATSTQFFLSLQAPFVRRLEDLASVLDWLQQDADDESRRAFEEVLHWPLVSSTGAFVHGAWSARHVEETDWNPTIELLNRAGTVARGLGLIRFGSEVAKAASIVYGEHLNDHVSAMRVLDDAATTFGETATIREQRVNALFQVKDDAGALDVWDALISNHEAANSMDAFAFRRAGISACRLERWPEAERYFLEGSNRAPELTLPITKLGLVVDACYVAAMAGSPQRAARMLSDAFLNLPPPVWEEDHEDWEAQGRVASTVCNLIEAVANGEDISKFTLAFGKASEPGLTFGPPQPNQVLRTQLTIARLGLIASQLGDISSEYRALLGEASKSHFPFVRLLAAQAELAFEFNAGPGGHLLEAVTRLERTFNGIASLTDRSLAMQNDGGHSEPTVKTLKDNGWISVFSAAAICCEHPAQALADWQNDSAAVGGPDSQIAKDLAEMSRGLGLSAEEANEAVRSDAERSIGETVGAALALLQAGGQTPRRTLRLQELLASATVCRQEGQLLQMTFGRAIARRFASTWKTFAASPFLFTNPRTSVSALRHAIATVEQGKGSMRVLLQTAAQAVGSVAWDVTSRLE
jgi:phage replication-related protein YjqB (UPF0714/DUF867 family)